jgi:hypothetical protein
MTGHVPIRRGCTLHIDKHLAPQPPAALFLYLHGPSQTSQKTLPVNLSTPPQSYHFHQSIPYTVVDPVFPEVKWRAPPLAAGWKATCARMAGGESMPRSFIARSTTLSCFIHVDKDRHEAWYHLLHTKQYLCSCVSGDHNCLQPGFPHP